MFVFESFFKMSELFALYCQCVASAFNDENKPSVRGNHDISNCGSNATRTIQ